MQNDELAKVKARIKALVEKTVENGCSEHEALLAAKKVGNLLAQYNLSMSEIDVREAKCATVRIQTTAKRRNEMWQVFGAIASFCGCKTWHTGNKLKGSIYNYFGHETDVQMAEYLFRLINQAIENGAETFKDSGDYRFASSRRSATVSFKTGMARRISERLIEMKTEAQREAQKRENEQREAARAAAEAKFRAENAERAVRVEAIHRALKRGEVVEPTDYAALNAFDVEVAQARSSSLGATGLIVLKGQLVNSEFEGLGLKLKTYTMRTTDRDRTALSHGRAAGERVNLSRPVSGGGRTAGLLS